MNELLTGLIAGGMTASAFILLVQKAGSTLKSLLIGHYLLTDIIGTFIAYSLLPVVGLATLISAGSFCLIFTLYLHYQRSNTQWQTIGMLIKSKMNK